MVDVLTGRRKKIEAQNEVEAQQAKSRDIREQKELEQHRIAERQALETKRREAFFLSEPRYEILSQMFAP